MSNPRRERAQEMFPQVLLAVLGVIQALALELVWERGVGGLDRWEAVDARAAGMLQVSAILLGVIVVWAMYASMVLRFSWTPRFRDLLLPFVLGISEFLVIELMTPERLAAWFVGMAGIFAISMGTTFETYRGAIRRELHDEPPVREQLGSYIPGFVALVGLLACAGLAAWFGPVSSVSLGALGAANAGLIGQMLVFRSFWRKDLGDAGPSAD